MNAPANVIAPRRLAREVVNWTRVGERGWREAHDQFKHLMAQTLGQTLAEGHEIDSGRAAALQQRLDELDGEGLARALLAPNSVHALFWRDVEPVGTRLDFLAQACDAERARRLGREAGPWTPLGDWGGAPAIAATRLACGVVVDFDSPDRLQGDGFPKAETLAQPVWAPADRQVLVNRLDEAMDAIAALEPQIARFISVFTRVVTPRISTTDGAGSSSTLTYPGRTIVINPLIDGGALDGMMETLVHEAIHSFIYQLEAQDWWVRLDLIRGERSILVTSPWTGAALPLHAYVHACFVWYGLWRFWRLALDREALPRPVLETRLWRCARGFLRSDVAEALGPHLHLLRPDIPAVCADMGEAVRAELA